MMAGKIKNIQHQFTTDIKASATPMPEKYTTVLTDSHIVPQAVLKLLCRWKAGKYGCAPKEEKVADRKKERNYMFRTDKGSSVLAEDCTTPFEKLLCKKCEKKFLHVDQCAFNFWEQLSSKWGKPITYTPKKNKEQQVDISKSTQMQPVDVTNIVLFSMIARAMYTHISLHCNRNLNFVLEMFLIEYGVDCEWTRARLNQIGFMSYSLPKLNCPKYRVEFPFVCALTLHVDRRSTRIETVCAQVPPFLCLIPQNPDDKHTLEPHLTKIAPAIHRTLDTTLVKFCRKYTEKNFKDWCNNLLNSPHLLRAEPLLLFDYLNRNNPLDVHIYF